MLLDPPTTALPAHLANTSDGSVANNCRIAHKAGSSYFSIITLRALEPGEEVLVSYGSKFTSMVRVAAALQQVAEEKETVILSYKASLSTRSDSSPLPVACLASIPLFAPTLNSKP